MPAKLLLGVAKLKRVRPTAATAAAVLSSTPKPSSTWPASRPYTTRYHSHVQCLDAPMMLNPSVRPAATTRVRGRWGSHCWVGAAAFAVAVVQREQRGLTAVIGSASHAAADCGKLSVSWPSSCCSDSRKVCESIPAAANTCVSAAEKQSGLFSVCSAA